MKQIQTLMELGSTVEVDLLLVHDRIPDELLKLLSDNPVGTVIDYKMTDGSGTGVVLRLKDGSFNWFFYEELKGAMVATMPLLPNSDKFQKGSISLEEKYIFESPQKKIKSFNSPINKPITIVDMFNPINFLRWFLYALKDVY